MLAVARGLTGSAGRQAEKRWDATASVAEMVPLDGGKLLCVGYGAIGRRVAAIGRSLGMQVVAFNRTGAGPGEAHRVARLSELDGEIGTATALILCLPATPETRGLLNAARIAALPERAIVVNVGRGELVEEAALIDALSNGRIAGAAIDVAIDEPLGPDNPLWAAPRLLITPHVAGQGEKTLPALASLVATNLRALRAGKELQNVLTR
jgi:phosphoglycerate dehydrogenase-like enzyme